MLDQSPRMNVIQYLPIVYMSLVLINMLKKRIDPYLVRTGYT